MSMKDDEALHQRSFLPSAVKRASKNARLSLTRATPRVFFASPMSSMRVVPQPNSWSTSAGSDAPAQPVPNLQRLSSCVQEDVKTLKPELQPLRQYLTEEDSHSERWVDRIFGLSNNDKINLNRLGIKNTTDQELRGIMWRLVQGRHCSGDVASMLRDSRVKWCLYNMFQTDIDLDNAETKVFVIRFFSKFSEVINKLMLLITYLSIWYSTFIFFYWEVVKKNFQNNGPPQIEDAAMTLMDALRAFDVFFNVLYFGGTMVRLRTSHVDAIMATETVDPQKIWKATVREWTFWSDAVSCFGWLEMASRGYVPRSFLLIALLRSWRLRSFSCTSWFLPSDGTFNTLFLIIIIILWGHLVGGLFYLNSSTLHRHPGIHRRALYLDDATRHLGGMQDSTLLSDLYFYTLKTGVYLTLAIDVGGYSWRENLFIAIMSPVGAVVNALVFSEIIIRVTRRSALHEEHKEHTENIRQAMAKLALPSTLQLRVLAYNKYEKIHRSQATYNMLFQGLNSQLNFELSLVLYYELLTNTPFFKKAQPKLLRELVVALHDVLFLPGDYVCRFGDEGKEMYFIYRGDCSVIHENMTTVLKTLHSGDYFGEIALLTNQKRTAFVRADFFCTLAALNKDQFDSIMRQYPKQLEVIVSLMSDLQKALIEKYNKEQKDTRRPSYCPPFVRSRANSRIFPDTEQPTEAIKNENNAVAETKSSSPTDSDAQSQSRSSPDSTRSIQTRLDTASTAHQLEPGRKLGELKGTLPTIAVPPGTSVNPSKQPSLPGEMAEGYAKEAAESANSSALDNDALGSKLSILALQREANADDDDGDGRVSTHSGDAMPAGRDAWRNNHATVFRISSPPKISVHTVHVAPPSPKRNMSSMMAELAKLEKEMDLCIRDLVRSQDSIDNTADEIADWVHTTREDEQTSRRQCHAALDAITAQAEFTRDEVMRLLTVTEEEDDLGAKAAGIVEATLHRSAEKSAAVELPDDTSDALLL